MQVGVANPGSFASFGGFGFGGSSPVGPPASPRWDASNLLDVQVDHMARETSHDGFADPIGLPGGGLVSRRRFRPALSSHRVTVRTDTTVPCTASSWLMRRADHLWVRCQCSMRSTVSALVWVGRWAGALGGPQAPRFRPGGNGRPTSTPVARAMPASAATWAMGRPAWTRVTSR